MEPNNQLDEFLAEVGETGKVDIDFKKRQEVDRLV
jgi:hypothetical protein